ncbi:MAG: NifU family protein [Bdellovibrionota bacterium]
MTDRVTVDLEFTPNPNSLKYITNPPLIEKGGANFKNLEAAKGKSPLAEKLFALEGVNSVMVAQNFVTVSIASFDRLTELNDEIMAEVKKFLESGEKAITADIETLDSGHSTQRQDLTDVEKTIVEILDKEIRPSVAMDGGDITFEKYEDGILFLQMKGSCAGCPSSTMTLKMGIENRLRQIIPDLIEVVSI